MASESAANTKDLDEAARRLRVVARRRLIGAAALLLLAVIVVPMLVDPAPRPVPDNIPIDIPSEKTPFTPKLSAPLPDPQPTPEREKAEVPTPAPEAEPKVAAPQHKTEPPPRNEGKAAPKASRFALQAAALGSETAARELSDRLKKAGLAPFTEKVETRDGLRYRVRVGPYPTREDAERARARLRALGVNANVVAL